MAGRAFTRRLAVAAAAPFVSRPSASVPRTASASHLLTRPAAAAAPLISLPSAADPPVSRPSAAVPRTAPAPHLLTRPAAALRTAPARHIHSRPAAAAHLSLPVATPARHLFSPQIRTRSFATLTPQELSDIKEKIRAEVIAELRADGFLTKEQAEKVKVIVKAEVVQIEEKALSRHSKLADDFADFKVHEIERFSEVKTIHTESLVRVATVAWRVCIGVLSLTAFILFEFYDIVKVGWEARVLRTTRDLIDKKIQELEDRLTRKLKSMLKDELDLLCARLFLKNQQAKEATADEQDRK